MHTLYADPTAYDRALRGMCPECGELPLLHDGWGGPGCTLTDNGVAQRLHDFQLAAQAAPPPLAETSSEPFYEFATTPTGFVVSKCCHALVTSTTRVCGTCGEAL